MSSMIHANRVEIHQATEGVEKVPCGGLGADGNLGNGRDCPTFQKTNHELKTYLIVPITWTELSTLEASIYPIAASL